MRGGWGGGGRGGGGVGGTPGGAGNGRIDGLLGRVADVPVGEVWVHCAAGYRASIAASILTAAGSRVVAVDDSFAEQATVVGLPVVTAHPHTDVA